MHKCVGGGRVDTQTMTRKWKIHIAGLGRIRPVSVVILQQSNVFLLPSRRCQGSTKEQPPGVSRVYV